MWLWRLTRPKIYRVSQQAPSQKSPCHSSSLSLETWELEPDGIVLDWSPTSSRPRKNWCFSLSANTGKSQCSNWRAVRQEHFCFTERRSDFFFYSGLQLNGCKATHIREDDLFYYLLIISSKNILTEIPIVKVLVTQSYLTFCNPVDSSPPGSSVPGIIQAKILEWVAIAISRD